MERIKELQGQEAASGGLQVQRYFTIPGVDPFDQVDWERRTARIVGSGGTVVFEQPDVEFPRFWSQRATDIVAQKYFRGKLGSPERERSVRQMIGRVADTITRWGAKDGYFASPEDPATFRAELTYLLLHQMAAFNSPVWFNVGFEEKPQCSACFILSIDDNMESILEWYRTEGMIFRGGSGSGINLSRLRSSNEQLSKGGKASGPVSFMRGADAIAGTIKSGGKCFKRGTLVATPDGWRPIETLHIGDLVLTHKGPRAVADFMPNGLKQCYKVRTQQGYEVEVTRGHKFTCWNAQHGGFDVKPIEDFKPSERLYLLLEPSEGGTSIPLVVPDSHDPPQATTTVEMKFPTELNEALAYVLGLTYGDGNLCTEPPYQWRVAFCKDQAGYASAERFREYCVFLFEEEPLLLRDEAGYQVFGFTRKRLVEFLVANGLAKGKRENLGFPKALFGARPEARAAFVAGLIDADGSYQRRGGWYIASIDRAFLVELQRLFLTLGVPSKIKLSREQKGSWQPLYRLCIGGHTFIERLVERIAPYSAKATFNYEPSAGADKGWGYRPSLLTPLASRVEQRGGYILVERTVGMNKTTGYGALASLSTHPDVAVADYAEELSHCVQVILESVEPTEVAETYDIEVEDVHLLSANGLYASNTRRAAKMVVLNVDHPDIREFIWCKSKEERKAYALSETGYDMTSLDSEGWISIQYQNANNSVRVTDEFMRAVIEDKDWHLRAITTGEIVGTYKARDLLRQIAEAAWECGDPGLQYDTTTNDWHTCPNSGRINASNPCSEYVHLDSSACNLASLNLMKFYDTTTGEFNTEAFRHAVDVIILAQEIIVGNSSYPTERITMNAKAYRQLGLGYANLGALLMARGLPYDSDEGRAYAATITALLTGEAYAMSARVAEKIGPFASFAINREPMLRVIRKHRDSVKNIDSQLVPKDLFQAAQQAWDEALALGEEHGYRNAQASVLAPTGTIAFMLDCDTTGVEPDIALVKYKKLVGGGEIKMINHTVPVALRRLGYSEDEIAEIMAYIDERGTIEGAPHLKVEHLPVFDCAFRPSGGTRSIHYVGHIRMMAAVQPFISGAISKTANLPHDVTPDDIAGVYIEGWKQGLKALAIYRDGSKRVQPLSTGREKSTKDKPAKVKDIVAEEPEPSSKAAKPVRRRLPDTRRAITHHFTIHSQDGSTHDGYITVGMYEDGSPGEIFVTVAKEGSTISGLMDAFATAISIALQYGVPLGALVRKFSHMRFEPSGVTTNPEVRVAKSLVDYIFRWLASQFLDEHAQEQLGVMTPAVREKMARALNGEEHEDAPTGTNIKSKTTYISQADAPSCPDCGQIMVRNGSCYRCHNCGSASGCS